METYLHAVLIVTVLTFWLFSWKCTRTPQARLWPLHAFCAYLTENPGLKWPERKIREWLCPSLLFLIILPFVRDIFNWGPVHFSHRSKIWLLPREVTPILCCVFSLKIGAPGLVHIGSVVVALIGRLEPWNALSCVFWLAKAARQRFTCCSVVETDLRDQLYHSRYPGPQHCWGETQHWPRIKVCGRSVVFPPSVWFLTRGLLFSQSPVFSP